MKLFRVIVQVSDMERAAKFYSALLHQPANHVEATRYYFYCGDVILACVDPREHGGTAQPNPDHVYFAVDDLEAAFERAKEAGCQWLEDRIATRPWGERSFYARDPFGNPLCFVDEATMFTGR